MAGIELLSLPTTAEGFFEHVVDFFQGGNKRPGAFAIYLEPWHADVFDFLDLRKNHGKEEQRARDLFYALWIPDLVRYGSPLFIFLALGLHRWAMLYGTLDCVCGGLFRD